MRSINFSFLIVGLALGMVLSAALKTMAFIAIPLTVVCGGIYFWFKRKKSS